MLPGHINHLQLELFTFYLELLYGFDEERIAVPLARALDGEDEVIPLSPQLDLALEFWVSETLTADRVLHWIFNHRLELPSVALIATPGLAGFLLGYLVQANNAVGETLCKFLRVGAEDGLSDVNGGHQSVRCCGDGRELGVVKTDALVHVHGQINGLSRAQLGDQDIRVHRSNGILTAKVFNLFPRRHKDNILGIHMRIVIRLKRIRLVR